MAAEKKYFCAFALITAVALTGASRAEQDAIDLARAFTASALPPDVQMVPVRAFIMQTWPVQADLELLAELREGDKVDLGAVPGASWPAIVQRVEVRGPMQVSLAGGFQEMPHSSFLLVVEEDVVVGVIRLYDLNEHYEIRFVRDDVHLIRRYDPTQFPRCGLEGAAAVPPPPPLVEILNNEGPEALVNALFRPREDREPEIPDEEEEMMMQSEIGGVGVCTSWPIFDQIVIYTHLARQALGGTNAARAFAQLCIDSTNDTYINSNIGARVRLAHTAEVVFSESGTFEWMRNHIQNPSSGVLDFIPGWRNDFGADMVGLLVSSATDDDEFCGIAYCTPASTHAYHVTHIDCAVGNLTFAHEVGHLQGCAHDPANAGSGCNWFSYSYGHNFFGSDSGWYRTVMSTNQNFTRVPHFSNPNVTFQGTPTGTADRNNAATIHNRRFTLENWRSPKFEVWVQFNTGFPWTGSYATPWPDLPTGISQAHGGGGGALHTPSLSIKPGTTNWTGVINKAMYINACSGTVVIGQQ